MHISAEPNQAAVHNQSDDYVPAQSALVEAQAPQIRHGFSVGGRGFLIGYEQAASLSEMPKIFRLPNTPNWLLGMANMQGVVLPVFDLAIYLGIERPRNVKRMLLTVGSGAQAAGVVVDGVTQLVDINGLLKMRNIESANPLKPFIANVWLYVQQPWYELRIFDWLKAVSEEIPR
jgi:twitching motility protein PilI